ncbi:hypothetical protein D0B54_00930 [Solimonas sp. K1W22B-7]|uniref:hypothetical protein n=1 Tax=Solimonas sp. K1W22B-7 TaxID=2303331 RepID=UPI000E331C1F|nr:hypothetical protein [Solimonas sp. K1W22B-7]AXQ27338.1 hypothetical protein D0B54_00930 [Solimonas sp. K1W22B-7]
MLTPDQAVQGYLEAAIESSSRARRMVLISVTASVIIFAAALANRPNPWFNWGHLRVQHVEAKFTSLPANAAAESKALIQHKREFYADEHARRAYVEIPFFGVRVDINDLGIVGGCALIIIALMQHSSVRREVDNIAFIFDSAKDIDDFRTRYRILAMHQVITPVPLKDFSSHQMQSTLSTGLFLPIPVAYGTLVFVDGATALLSSDLRTPFLLIFTFEVLVLTILVAISRRTSTDAATLGEVWRDAVRRQASGV